MYATPRVGFMERMRRGWQLTKLSLNVVKQDKHLILFPMIAGIGLLLALAGFAGLGAWLHFTVGIGDAEYILLVLAYYFVTYFITIYFNVALIVAVKERLDGRTPTLGGGIKGANGHIGAILGWTLVAATVGLILQVLQNAARNQNNFIAQIIVQLVGMAWSVITYFVLPIIAAEGMGPIKAIKESTRTIKRTWGEALVGTFAMGAIFFIVGLVGAVALVFITFVIAFHPAVLIGGILVALLWVLAVVLVHATAKQVLVAALYRYATTGEAGGVMSQQQARAAFNPQEPWEEFTDPNTGRIRGA